MSLNTAEPLTKPGVGQKAQVTKKGIWGWMLFDWAAQPLHTLLITFFFARYFATEVAPDPETGQVMWGWMLAISGVTIAILSPVLGSIADATGPRKPWMAFFGACFVIGSCLLWFAEPGGAGMVFWILVFFSIALFGESFASVFNNAVMTDLVPREELGRLSGNGWALGYLGGVVSLIFVLLLLVESSPGSGVTLIGIPPILGLDAIASGGQRAVGPLTGLWFLIFVIPFFLFTPDAPRREKVAGAVSKGLSDLMRTIRSLPKTPSLFAYLGSSMFYRDALNGLYAFGGIYAGGVLQWSATQLGLFGILAALTGALGAWMGGKFDDRFGPKMVVTTSILMLIVVCLIIVTTDRDMVLYIPVADSGPGFAPADIAFYICGALIGAAGGSLQASSRTLMADQADDDNMTEAFGLYALSGRASSFLAPAMIAMATDFFGNQRIGIMPLIPLFLIGLFLLPWVQQRNAKA
ncbi:MFS transporter [Pseudahrensia aquimaris]|uniref:MFS transporter n=1 Tax=Pseudahrensia aquimaris TaxID=744461 RepID=A0ABW3FIV2_9HYPH